MFHLNEIWIFSEPPVFCDGVPEWWRSDVPYTALREIRHGKGSVSCCIHSHLIHAKPGLDEIIIYSSNTVESFLFVVFIVWVAKIFLVRGHVILFVVQADHFDKY